MLLQRQDPQIHHLLPAMHSFVKKCLLRIVDPTVVSSLDIWTCEATTLSVLPDDEINIGSLAEHGLCGLTEMGMLRSIKKPNSFQL